MEKTRQEKKPDVPGYLVQSSLALGLMSRNTAAVAGSVRG